MITPEDAVTWAVENGINTVVLCDTTMCGVGRFVIASKRAPSITAVVGLRVGKRTYLALDNVELRRLMKAYSERRITEVGTLLHVDVEPVRYLPGQQEIYEAFNNLAGKVGALVNYKAYQPETADPTSVWPSEARGFDVALREAYEIRSNQRLPKAPNGFLESFLHTPGSPSPEVERLRREIALIKARGLDDYFFTIKRIVDIAKSEGVLIGPGRGSAVSSLLLHKMGVTRVNPLEHDLLFERFLNEGRSDNPDVDIDVEDEARAQLIDRLRQEFGFVYQISAFSTLPKKFLTGFPSDLTRRLSSLPVQRTTHAAGLVVSTIPVDVPTSPGTQVLEWDMNTLEALGYIKIDLLGLKTLSVLKALQPKLPHSIEELASRGERSVFAYIGAGFTDNVFQLDSNIGKVVSRDLRPSNVSELALCISLNRPGPLRERIPRLIGRAKAENKVRWKLDLLRETYGYPVYQEQVMRIAMDIAGLTEAEADTVRRAIAKRDTTELKPLFGRIEKALFDKLGDEGRELAKTILSFGEYAFNKSHAVAYAHLTYAIAYLKTKFPREFYDAILKYDTSALEDAIHNLRALGFKIVPPRINIAERGAFEDESRDKVYVLPLYVVPGIGPRAAEELSRRIFKDFNDFAENSGLNPATVEALVKIGTFDELFQSRRRALRHLRGKRSKLDLDALRVGGKLFGKKMPDEHQDDEDAWERTHMEFETLGVALTPPVQCRNRLAPYSLARSLELPYGVHVSVKAGFGTDGESVFKLNAPDGDYTLVYPKTLHTGSLKVAYVLSRRPAKHEVSRIRDVDLDEPWEFTVVKPGGRGFSTVHGENVFPGIRPVLNEFTTRVLEPRSRPYGL